MGYNTIFKPVSAEFTEKKSRFIGNISPMANKEDVIKFIDQIRSENRKATHNVYAYILRDGNTSGYSDDKEPQGTAGIPVLNVLQKENLTDICCVVTRYFGGILLGGGGLVRAYSHAAKLAIESAHIMIMTSCYKVQITLEYNMYGKINCIFPEFQIKVLNIEFNQNVIVSLLLKTDFVESFKNKISDITNGDVSFVQSDELFEDFS